MDIDLLTSLGARPIGTIEAPDVVAVVKAIEQRGARDLAKRALETIGQIFRYGIAHGYARRNPASEIKPADILKATLRVNFARIDGQDLPDLLKAIEIYRGTPMTRLAFKLMALSFVRTSELIGAKWSEFDLAAARWNIPADRMKMKTPHIVPLAKQTLEVLESRCGSFRGMGVPVPGGSQKRDDEQQHHPQRSGAHGLQRQDDRAWFPGVGLDDLAREGVRSRAHRTATRTCSPERCQCELQPCVVSSAALKDDAGLGGLLGTDSAWCQGSTLPVCGVTLGAMPSGRRGSRIRRRQGELGVLAT